MAPELFYAPTADGWQLAVHHWMGRGPRRNHPVMMVHGLAANRLNIDLDEEHSIARAARDRGFDVYIVELRGAGMSRPPGGRDRALFEWGFSEHDSFDLPAAVAAILRHAEAEMLHGFGHSMGGMLILARGVRRPPELRSITIVGSPLVCQLNLGPRESRLLRLASRFGPSGAVRRVPLRQVVGAAGRLVSLSSRLADGMLLNVANCDVDTIGRIAREAINDIPFKMLAELYEQMDAGCVGSGPFAYEAVLDRINVPIQALSGSADRVAPPSSVAAVVERLVSRDVRYREMGVCCGDRFDYGHADLLVGQRARDEVYPVVLDFIEEMD